MSAADLVELCKNPRFNSPSQASSSATREEEMSERSTTPLTSTPPSETGFPKSDFVMFDSRTAPEHLLADLFSENIIAKALRTAKSALKALPDAFPEYVPQDEGSDGSYHLREADFWTCGFFPGTLYAILERLVKFPQAVYLLGQDGLSGKINITHLRDQISTLCRTWTEPLHGMASRTDTHDIGFIVMPALRAEWELTGNPRSLESINRAAVSLATRYVPSAKAIRSWDLLKKNDIEIVDQDDNMIVIIDSLCNLDLLYYASKHYPESSQLAEIATAHAKTLLQSHLRPVAIASDSESIYMGQLFSTCHVANLDPNTGAVKQRLTAQGYAHESTWARGQAWGILGYAQTYMWTKDKIFLHAACGLAEYFLHRLKTAPACVEVVMADGAGGHRKKGRLVPIWDFDAPIENPEDPVRDSSAGIIAANGMLILAQALNGLDLFRLGRRFQKAALDIVQDTLAFALAPEKAKLVNGAYQQIYVEDMKPGATFEAMLKFGTANNNANARKRYANHGLVYGDYYLVEFGNRLLRMGYI